MQLALFLKTSQDEKKWKKKWNELKAINPSKTNTPLLEKHMNLSSTRVRLGNVLSYRDVLPVSSIRVMV